MAVLDQCDVVRGVDCVRDTTLGEREEEVRVRSPPGLVLWRFSVRAFRHDDSAEFLPVDSLYPRIRNTAVFSFLFFGGHILCVDVVAVPSLYEPNVPTKEGGGLSKEFPRYRSGASLRVEALFILFSWQPDVSITKLGQLKLFLPFSTRSRPVQNK